ncbi:MAG: response regulator [bacterium]
MAGEKILVIDDNLNTQELLKHVFENESYRVFLASTSREALEKAAEIQPQLIVLDIILPDINGYQLLESIKREPNLKFIPVIILSAKNETEDKLRGLRLGVVDYLTKPFQRAELTTRVRNVLDFYNIKLQNLDEVNGQKPWGRLLKHLEENSISKLIPVVRKEAKLGYEYPDAAKVLQPDDIGGEIFTLERLAKEKHLDRVFYDTIHICPLCGHHDLNFRDICQHCNSAEIMAFDVIIHIKCGHKSMEYEFRRDGELICPACHKKLSTQGIDYEKTNRPVYQCLTCRKKFSESNVHCRCMNCDRTFSAEKAIKRKIYSYLYHKFDEDLAEDLVILQDRGAVTQGSAPANGNAAEKELLRVKKTFEEVGLEVLNWQFFPHQLRLEIKRSRKHNLNLSVLKLSLLREDGVNFDSVNELPQPVFRKILQILQKCLRELDVVSIRNQTEFVVLLPETPLSMAKILGNRFQNYIDHLKASTTTEVSVSGYPEDGMEADQLLEVLNLNLAILKPDDSQEDFTLS